MSNTRLSAEIQHFDATAGLYGTSWWGQTTPAGHKRIARRRERVLGFLKKWGCRKVLEVGCGTGVLTRGIANGLRQLCALDLSSEMLRLAQASGIEASFLRASLDRLPFSDGVFDAVIGDGILHHVNLEPALREIRRVLNSPGAALFFEPNMANPQIFLERHVPWIRRFHQTPDETAFYRRSFQQTLNHFWKNASVEPFDFLHPSIPPALIPTVEQIGFFLERCPGVREMAGSLCIEAWGGESP